MRKTSMFAMKGNNCFARGRDIHEGSYRTLGAVRAMALALDAGCTGLAVGPMDYRNMGVPSIPTLGPAALC